jgi:fluoride ion exporter CrcB/FEX
MLETESLRERGEGGVAAANVIVSLALGLAAVALGWAAAAAL